MTTDPPAPVSEAETSKDIAASDESQCCLEVTEGELASSTSLDQSMALPNTLCSQTAVDDGSPGLPPQLEISKHPTSPLASTTDSETALVDNQQLMRQVNRLQRDVDRLRKERDEEKRQRMIRDAEVESLRQYAMASDESHGPEAASLIDSINNATLTLAAALSLSWILPEKKGQYRVDKPPSFLANTLAQCPPSHLQAPLLLQIAFQDYILGQVSWIINQACLGKDEKLNELIREIEKKAQSRESQPTFARWRAITYGIFLEESTLNQQQLSSDICQNVIKEFHYFGYLLTGCSLDRKPFDRMANETREGMQDIISQSFQFAIMVRTKILSANYYYYDPVDKPYVKDDMELPYSDPDEVPLQNERVVAVVRLGLRRAKKLGRGNVDGMSQTSDSVQSKAHVLTKSGIEALVNDPSTLSQRVSAHSSLQDTRTGSRSESPDISTYFLLRIFTALWQTIGSIPRRLSWSSWSKTPSISQR